MKVTLQSLIAQFQRILNRKVLRGRPRRMRLCETLSLGEKRFLAVVRVDRQQFLIGGGGGSVALLSRLSAAEEIPEKQLDSNISVPQEGTRYDVS